MRRSVGAPADPGGPDDNAIRAVAAVRVGCRGSPVEGRAPAPARGDRALSTGRVYQVLRSSIRITMSVWASSSPKRRFSASASFSWSG